MTEAAQSSGHHITALARVVIWVVTLAVVAGNFGLAYLPLGAFQLVVAYGLALANVVLVMTFFMDLLEQRGARRFTLVVAGMWFLLLLGLVLLDVGTRFPPTRPSGAREGVEEKRPQEVRAKRRGVGPAPPHRLEVP